MLLPLQSKVEYKALHIILNQLTCMIIMSEEKHCCW